MYDSQLLAAPDHNASVSSTASWGGRSAFRELANDKTAPPRPLQLASKAAGVPSALSSAAVGWSRPTNERCMVCNRAADVCACEHRAVKDKAKTKKAIDSLSLSTPFGRARVARTMQALKTVEEEQREEINAEAEDGYWYLEIAAECSFGLLELRTQEAMQRQVVEGEQRRRRTATQHLMHHDMRFVCLSVEETHSRERIVVERLSHLDRWRGVCDSRLGCYAVALAESSNRAALSSDEASRRTKLFESERRNTQRLVAFERDRRAVVNDALEGRSAIITYEADLAEQLYAGFQRGSELVEILYADRRALLEKAVGDKRFFSAEEGEARQALRQRLLQGVEDIAEMIVLFGEERHEMWMNHGRSRDGVLFEERDARHHIVATMRRGSDAIQTLLDARAEECDAALLDAVSALGQIVASEGDRRDAIYSAMAKDVEGRRQWMLEKANARESFLQVVVHSREAVRTEEMMSRETVRDAMAVHYDAVCVWLDHLRSEQMAFSSGVLSEHVSYFDEEEDARDAILSRRESEVHTVHEWMSMKAGARNEVALREVDHRRALARHECEARDAWVRRFSDAYDDIERFHADCDRERDSLERECTAYGNALVSEEAEAFACLQTLADVGLEAAVQFTQDREQRFVMDEERRRRNGISLVEVEGRSHVATSTSAHHRLIVEEWRQVLEVASAEVQTHEVRLRGDIAHDEGDVWDHIVNDGHRSRADAARDETLRLEQERRDRQLELEEARRRSDEDAEEELTVGRKSYGVFRKSVQFAADTNSLALVAPSSSASGSVGSLDAAEVALQKDYVMSRIGPFFAQEASSSAASPASSPMNQQHPAAPYPPLQRVSTAFLYAIVSLIDATERVVDEREVYHTRTCKTHQEKQRTHARMLEKAESLTEQKQFYRTKLDAGARMHVERLAKEQDQTRRALRDKRLEESRLKGELDLLEQLQESIAQVKDRIHEAKRGGGAPPIGRR